MEYFSIKLKENYLAFIILNKEAKETCFRPRIERFLRVGQSVGMMKSSFPLLSTRSRGKNAQLKKSDEMA